MQTTDEIRAALAAAFPSVEFSVKRESQAFGTNYSNAYISISYNYLRSPVAPAAIQAVVPGTNVWARGIRRAA